MSHRFKSALGKILTTSFLLIGTDALLAADIAGSYVNPDNNGYMEIKSMGGQMNQIIIQTSGGSCAGEVFVKGKGVLTDQRLAIKHRIGKRACVTTIYFQDKGSAKVSDSCVKNEDEDGSTCAVLGNYNKQGN